MFCLQFSENLAQIQIIFNKSQAKNDVLFDTEKSNWHLMLNGEILNLA